MGEGGLVDGLVTGGSGVLAIAGIEGEGAEIDEMSVRVFAGFEIGAHGARPRSAERRPCAATRDPWRRPGHAGR